MQPLCGKGVLQCICLEMHLYVQAPFWSAVVAESTVMQQHRNLLVPNARKEKPNYDFSISMIFIFTCVFLYRDCVMSKVGGSQIRVPQTANPKTCGLAILYLLDFRTFRKCRNCKFAICGRNLFCDLQVAICGPNFSADLKLLYIRKSPYKYKLKMLQFKFVLKEKFNCTNLKPNFSFPWFCLEMANKGKNF